MTEEVTVDFWSDVMCPWCAIGATQLFAAIDQLAGDVAVTVRFMPFELRPDLAPEGISEIDYFTKMRGSTPEQAAEMRAGMDASGAEAGFPMAWQGEGEAPAAHLWNTHAAHKLLHWALATGGPAAQTPLKMALLRAQFQERRNIADHAVLLDIAEGTGLDRAAAAAALADAALSTTIYAEEERGRAMGINSVPTFVVAGKYVLQGSAPPEKFRQALVQIAQMEAAA